MNADLTDLLGDALGIPEDEAERLIEDMPRPVRRAIRDAWTDDAPTEPKESDG